MVVVLVAVVVVVAVVIVTVVAGVFATTCSRVVMFLFQVSIFTIFWQKLIWNMADGHCS